MSLMIVSLSSTNLLFCSYCRLSWVFQNKRTSYGERSRFFYRLGVHVSCQSNTFKVRPSLPSNHQSNVVWRVREKIICVLCSIVCSSCAHCTVQCRHMNRLNSCSLVRFSFSVVFLWSPYVIGRPYIFSSCFFFFLSSSFFFLA